MEKKCEAKNKLIIQTRLRIIPRRRSRKIESRGRPRCGPRDPRRSGRPACPMEQRLWRGRVSRGFRSRDGNHPGQQSAPAPRVFHRHDLRRVLIYVSRRRPARAFASRGPCVSKLLPRPRPLPRRATGAELRRWRPPKARFGVCGTRVRPDSRIRELTTGSLGNEVCT